MTWQRTDDALIARVAEGWDKKRVRDSITDYGLELPHYPTDLIAGHRALEAWSSTNPEGTYRSAEIIYRPWRLDDQYEVVIVEEPVERKSWCGEAPTLAEAIALALRAACEAER